MTRDTPPALRPLFKTEVSRAGALAIDPKLSNHSSDILCHRWIHIRGTDNPERVESVSRRHAVMKEGREQAPIASIRSHRSKEACSRGGRESSSHPGSFWECGG